MPLFDFAKDILGIAGSAAGIAGVLGRRGKTDAEKQMGAQLERANQLSAALGDYDNPMRASIRAQQMQLARDARLEGLRDMMAESMRSARRRPLGPAFYARDPRRDEMLMRAMTMAGQNEAARADAAARAEISGALGGATNTAAALGRGAEFMGQTAARRATALPTALFAGADLLGGIERTFGPRPSPDYGPNYGPPPPPRAGTSRVVPGGYMPSTSNPFQRFT